MSRHSPGQLSAWFARKLVAQYVPDFTGRVEWTSQGVSVQGQHGYIAKVEAPNSWNLRSGTGLGQHIPGRIAAVAAMGALLAALEPFVELAGGEVYARADNLLAALPRGPADEWLGFARIDRGWVGVVLLGDDARTLYDTLVERRSLFFMTPPAAAVLLQNFGIPAMSARQVAMSGGRFSTLISGKALVSQAGAPLDVLAGLRVADLGRLVAGPFAAQILAELGADVVRVRPPGSGDRWGGGVEVDLRTSGGEESCRTLAREVDIIVENGSPQAGARLELLLSGVRPPVWTAIRGFPDSSPCRNWRVFGFLVEAALGVGTGPHSRAEDWVSAPRTPLWDRVVGTVAAASTLSLLHGWSSKKRADVLGTSRLSLVGVALDLLTSRREMRNAG